MDGLLLTVVTNTALAAVLATIAWFVDRWLRRPAFAHTLYAISLLALVTPPLLRVEGWAPAPVRSEPVVAHAPEPVSGVVAVAVQPPPGLDGPSGVAAPREALRSAQAVRPDTSAQLPVDEVLATPLLWQRLLLFAWLVGSLGTLSLLALRYRVALRLVDRARPLTGEDSAELTARSEEFGLLRAPEALLVGAPVGPALLPTSRGVRLLLPDDWSTRFDAPTRRALLRHECAHLRRGDHRLRLLEALVTVVAWWHPLVWAIRAGLRDAEERACDAWVVAGTDARERRGYCEALISAASVLPGRSQTPVALTTGAVRSSTNSPRIRAWSRRLENVMTRETPSRTGHAERALAGLALLAFLPFGIAQDPVPRPGDLLTHLQQTRFAWTVEDAAADEWSADLAKRIGRPVRVTPRAADRSDAQTRLLGLRLPETDARRILDVVSTLTDLRWNAVEGGVVFDRPAQTREGQAASVHVLGAVQDPGPRTLRGEDTLLDVISQAEALDEADLSSVWLLRPQAPSGDGSRSEPLRVLVDVRSMLETGDMSRNVLLRDGDLLLVGEQHPELPHLQLRVGSRLHFVFDESLDKHVGMRQLALLRESQPVGRDGHIFVPYVGSLSVLGLTRAQVSDLMSRTLDELFIEHVRVEARFDPPK